MRGGLLALAVLLGVGAATSLLVASRRNAAADAMRAQLALDIERGGVAGLSRVQARARHLLVADPDDPAAVAALAFASAVLAVDYGLDNADEVRKLLARSAAAPAPADELAGMAAAARSLLLLSSGDRDGAARVAIAAARVSPDAPHPLYALGRARARAGDLAGASRALEAALVEAPGFTLAEVAWAEAQLDAGDAQPAHDALSRAAARSGEDPRTTLLLGEAERALGSGASTGDRMVCATLTTARKDDLLPRWPPAAIRAACELAQATSDRSGGRRAEALVHAEAAARLVPAEPRLLALTAALLAELGPVDWAAGLLERARHLAASDAPTLAWAAVAIALGRGRTPALPAARPADQETRLLVARAALSAGGVGALRAALKAFDQGALKHDADLALLAQLFGDDAPAERAADLRPTGGITPRADPWRAYLDGLRAELAGNLPDAAASFGRALSGHGDACRAAGEYLATLRLLKRPQQPGASGALTVLRAENAGCVNLH